MKYWDIVEATSNVMNSSAQSFGSWGMQKYVQESMSRAASIFKAKDGKWYYYIAHHEYGGFDEGDNFGPFPSEEAAEKHMDDRHSNPGGWDVDASGKTPVPKDLIDPRKG